MKKLFGFVFALVAASGVALAEERQASSNRQVESESKAVELSDVELDQITAGAAFPVLIIDNPGAASQADFKNRLLLLINTNGGTDKGATGVAAGNGGVHCIRASVC